MANKKKIGRPSKKRKSYYKSKSKGLRYITNGLLKKYPKRYKSRSEASDVAKQLLLDLKGSNTKVTLGNALKLLVDKRRDERLSKVSYNLPNDLIELKPYYDFYEYVDLIKGLDDSPRILFTSNIIPVGLPDIISGNEYEYEDYFAPFVNYIDKLRKLSSIDLYEQEWFIRCTEPKRAKGKEETSKCDYISRIIVCDVEGSEVSDGYGFDPNDVDKDVTSGLDVEKKEVAKKSIDDSIVDSVGISSIDKEIRLKELEIESDKLKIEKARELRALLDAKVPYEDAKRILGL